MARPFAPDPWTGKMVDITYRRLKPTDNAYTVHLGGIYIGQVHNLGISGWSSISNYDTHLNRYGQGFKNRWKATEFLLRTCGSWTEIHH